MLPVTFNFLFFKIKLNLLVNFIHLSSNSAIIDYEFIIVMQNQLNLKDDTIVLHLLINFMFYV